MIEMTPHEPRGLRDRYPIIERMGAVLRRAEIPVVHQTSAADCGAACLAMVVGYFGGDGSIANVRQQIEVGRDGTSAGQILDAAGRFELRGRGVRIEVEDLASLDPGA